MTDHPEPRSAHPGVEAAYAHLSLLTRGQTTTLAGSGWFPDISEFQGVVNWDLLEAAYRAGQIDGVAMRAGFGTVRADAQFARNQAEARARGIPVIYYWFNYFAVNTPEAEASKFNATVGPLQPREAMCGDFEDDGQFLFPRGAAGVDAARRFLTALQAPQNASWWYTYPFLLATVGLQPLLGQWPFWLADYSATPDSAFSPAIARQFTDCGATPGVGGCCDQSRVLRGPLTQWLTPGGSEVLDANDPVVQRIEGSLDAIYVRAASTQSDEGSAWTNGARLHAKLDALLAAEGVEKAAIDAIAATGAAAAQVTALKAELDAVQAALQAGTGAGDLSKVYADLAALGKHLGVDVTTGADT